MQLRSESLTGGRQDSRILRLLQQPRVLELAAVRKLQAREARIEAAVSGAEVAEGIVLAHEPHAKLAGDGLEAAEAREVRELREAPELDVT